VSYVPQAVATGHPSHAQAARDLLLWNNDAFEQYASMMVFDSLIYNTDRHLTNFGMLRDSHTGGYLSPAPLFDNGRSLFFDLGFNQSGYFSQESRFKLPSWSQVTFEEQAARLIGPVQQAQLKKLQGFEFANSAKLAFPTLYLKDLSRFIQKRAEQLFSFPAQSREALREAAQATRYKNSSRT
ncbi:MAG: hypothetical protein RR241_04530, partial [Raoultibacter sp.]